LRTWPSPGAVSTLTRTVTALLLRASR
jgi:hypothetical protein